MILRRVSPRTRGLDHAPRVGARDAPKFRVGRLQQVRVDAARPIDTAQRVRREIETEPAAERLAPETLALRVRLERPPRLPVAKTDVVAEADVLARVDAALAPVAREGARRCGRRWSRRGSEVASSPKACERRAEHRIDWRRFGHNDWALGYLVDECGRAGGTDAGTGRVLRSSLVSASVLLTAS